MSTQLNQVFGQGVAAVCAPWEYLLWKEAKVRIRVDDPVASPNGDGLPLMIKTKRAGHGPK
ncbi:hypothetical protein [Lewinella cohaerens]|uniref:hypothetical protein n=1 Tax=Lewinella cohaerens TaxID=70995 RepID=UPI0012EBA90D|nr:hypothetical protein [Lewinella cohaerens]